MLLTQTAQAGILGPLEFTYTEDAGPHLVDHRGERRGPDQCLPRVGCIATREGGSFYFLRAKNRGVAEKLMTVRQGEAVSVVFESMVETQRFYTYDHTYRVVVTDVLP